MQVFYLQQGLDHGTLRKLCRAPIHEKMKIYHTQCYMKISLFEKMHGHRNENQVYN